MENSKKDRTPRTKWSESATKALLSFLLEHKNKLEELKYTRGATSNPGNVQLWKDAETFLLSLNFDRTYSNVQIANKWKNLVDNYKVVLNYKQNKNVLKTFSIINFIFFT
jgi:hypothetical protein